MGPFSPGQGLLEQGFSSSRSPRQSAPLMEGSGEVQVRVLVLVPVPQETVQGVQVDQSVTPPSTAEWGGLGYISQTGGQSMSLYKCDW